MKTNQDYKNAALAALKGNWAPAVLATVIVVLIVIACILPEEIFSLTHKDVPTDPEAAMAFVRTALCFMGLSILLYIFIIYPLDLGYCNACKKLLVDHDNDMAGNTFRIALDGYGRKAWGMFLVWLFTFLWSLLFIIPGIVKTFAYAMTPFILEDNPELSAKAAIDRSVAMMKGHKFDLFYLCLSFIGWALLAILTLGIGLLWLMPYMQTSIVSFYEDVKEQYEEIAVEA